MSIEPNAPAAPRLGRPWSDIIAAVLPQHPAGGSRERPARSWERPSPPPQAAGVSAYAWCLTRVPNAVTVLHDADMQDG